MSDFLNMYNNLMCNSKPNKGSLALKSYKRFQCIFKNNNINELLFLNSIIVENYLDFENNQENVSIRIKIKFNYE